MMRAVIAAVATVLLCAPPALAHHHRRPAAASIAGQFDYFLLSLSLAPSFCASSAHAAATAECRDVTLADFRQTPLTVHGLWPNRADVSVNQQPSDCSAPPLDDLPAQTATALRRYMPGGPDLAAHEWQKHGACSGLTPGAYFAAIVRWAEKADDTIGAALRDQGALGGTLRIDALLAAVQRTDPALAGAIVVDCRQPRGGGPAVVEEIRLTLSRDLVPIPVGSVGLGQNSGCPAGAGQIPAPGA